MKIMLRIVYPAIFLFFMTQVCLAAFLDSQKLQDEEGTPKKLNQADDSFGKIIPAPEIKFSEKKIKGENELSIEAAQKKLQLILKAEPGDGLVSLSWKIVGVLPKVGEQDISFVLYYGSESGRYDKKVEFGNVSEYRLRELKNNITYYIKIEALFKKVEGMFLKPDDETRSVDFSILSNEIKVVPRPVEERGSPLEKVFAEKTVTLQDTLEVEPLKRELRQFGYDFFKNSLASIASNENVPVGDDYVLGPGDTLNIDLWGSIQARLEVAIDRNGEISLPKMGTVKVWGLSFANAKEAINKAISRYYKKYELNMTLGRLKSIQVYVVGAVEAPGTYTISSTGTVLNALSLSRGPTRDGSLRAIRINRKGKVVEEVDLYDTFLSGDRSKDIRLENGDTIYVPVIGPVVAVAGEVKRVGIYELRNETSLLQVLELAGGITAAGETSRIQVERIENGTRTVLDCATTRGQFTESLSKFKIFDRDMIKVFPVPKALRQVIALNGSVVRGGEYQFKPGMKLKDVLTSTEILLPDTYFEAGEIIRLVPPDRHKETISFNLNKLFQGDDKENLSLQDQDTIHIFSRWDMVAKPVVSINGQVLKPGSYNYFPKMTVRDLIVAAGSLKRNAFMDGAELTRVEVLNGKATSTRFDVNLTKALLGDLESNLELKPDDVLIVRGVVEWLESSDRFVKINGEVQFPGIYSINKGERLSALIRRAGGFTEKAFLSGAKFTRKSVQLDQQKRMEEILARTEQDLLKKQGELASLAASKEELEATKASLEGLMKNLEKLKTLKAEGRVVMRLSVPDELERGEYDLELRGGDVIDIPQMPRVVNVMGYVYNPTSFIHTSGSSADHYMMKAGGPTRDAEESDIYIIKADGSVISKQQAHWDGWLFGGFMSASMEQGDTLVVPQKLERIAWMRDIKDITQILANVAVTFGTVLIGLR